MRLLIFGLGYCGTSIAEAAYATGMQVTGTVRSSASPDQDLSSPSRHPGAAYSTVPFEAAAACLQQATHVLSTVPPDADGDPVLRRFDDALASATSLQWIGYLSSTVVYGNRDGAWVDESTPPAPSQPRGQRRLAAERAWEDFAAQRRVDIFRLAGIYGPGRSPFAALRAGQARRVVKPGHLFGRIHRDDVAQAVVRAMHQPKATGARVLNLADDEPAESAAVLTYAAELLGVPPPPAVTFTEIEASLTPMARSFWAENRKVASRETKRALEITWRYPSYRQGLAATLRAERDNLAT